MKCFFLLWLPLFAIPLVIQNLADSEVGAPKFDQAKPIVEEGAVLHRPDETRLNSGDAGTGSNQVLNHERYNYPSYTPVEHRQPLIRDPYGKGKYVDYFRDGTLSREGIQYVLEIGSRDCVDALELSSYFKTHVYAFECNPLALTICQHNIRHNPNVTLVPFAVWPKSGLIPFHSVIETVGGPRNLGASSCFRTLESGPDSMQRQEEITVPAIRLDTWMEGMGFDHIDLLCMDTQGATLPILQSLGPYLQRVKYVITEVYYESSYAGEELYVPIKRFMESQGFWLLTKNRTGPFGDAIFMKQP